MAIGVTLLGYKANNSSGGGNTVTTASLSPTAGSTLVAFTRDGTTNTVLSVTQGGGANTFTQKSHDETADPSMTVWICENCAGTSGTAVATMSSASTNYDWLAIVQVTGVDAASYDTSNKQHVSSPATALLTTSITTAGATEAVIMAAAQDNFSTLSAHTDSAGNTWSLLVGNIHDSSGNFGGIQYFTTASALSGVTAQITSDTNTNYTTIWIALKSTGGGGGFFGSPLMAIRAGHGNL